VPVQRRQSSNLPAIGTCVVSKKAINQSSINLLSVPVGFLKAGNQAINLILVPIGFPKQAIKQSTCYQYLLAVVGAIQKKRID
jgi:hypothetical protein